MSRTPLQDKRTPGAGTRGRPLDRDKHAAILQAAESLFTACGLNGVSVDDIARAASVSKVTVYSHFSSKDELFRQTIQSRCSQQWPDALFDVQARTPLRERLQSIGVGFLDLVYSENVLNIYRLMIAQPNQPSDFGRLFWEAGPERTIHRLSQVIAAAAGSGEIDASEPTAAAAHFFVLLKGTGHLRVLLGSAAPPGAADRRRHVDKVVDLFLRAYRR